MRRIIAVLSVMGLMVAAMAAMATPAFAAPRNLYITYNFTCPDGTEVEVGIMDNPRDFAEIRKEVNRALVQATQSGCKVTRSTSPL